MILSHRHRKVVLNLRNPARVTTVIPTAKLVPYKGADLVAIPHALDETRVLRNLGFEVPSPVNFYYDWPGQYKPFEAQRATTAFLTVHPRAFVLNGLGSGKTLATLWAYDYLRSIKRVRKMLVVSPLSTLERTWADEIFRHFPHLNWAVLYGTRDRRLKMLKADVDIYIVNHDGVKVLKDELAKRDDIDVVVIDEIASFRNASTTRWRAMRAVIEKRQCVWGLTGTPTPNEPTDAWAQCRLICPKNVPQYASAFRDQVMRQVSQFKWVARDNATEVVQSAMQPSIRFAREDCVDLPECIYQTHHVEMSPEQKKSYADMVAALYMEYQGDQVLAVNEAVKMQKLIQIAAGVVYGADGVRVHLPGKERIDLTRDIIEQAGTKTIVFVPFTGVLEAVANELRKDFTVEVVNGQTPKAQRDVIFDNFQRARDPRVLVAQPAAMSHGLTLTAANTVVWFAPITSNEVYEQANGRITRPGQKHTQLIVHIEGSDVERKVYERLRKKQKMQGLLLDEIKAQKKD